MEEKRKKRWKKEKKMEERIKKKHLREGPELVLLVPKQREFQKKNH